MLEKIQKIQDSARVKLIAEYILLSAVIIEVMILIADKSRWINPYEGILFKITFVLCLIKVLLTKYELKEYAVIFLFALAGLLVKVLGDRNEILRIVIFIAALKNTDVRKNLKTVFWGSFAGCAVIVLLSIFGIYGELTVEKEYLGKGFIERYCFGMGNANTFHVMVFALALLFMYLYREKLKWWAYALLLMADIGLFFLTDAKTPMIIMALSVIAMYMAGFLSQKGASGLSKLYRALLAGGNVFAVLVSVFFAIAALPVYKWYFYSEFENPWVKFDRILTGRIRMLTDTTSWADIKSWTFLPEPSHTRYFDLGFVRIFYWYGIAIALLILLVMGALVWYLYRNEKTEALILVTMVSFFTIFEAHFVSVYIARCYPLFILGACWPLMLKGKRKEAGSE